MKNVFSRLDCFILYLIVKRFTKMLKYSHTHNCIDTVKFIMSTLNTF